MKTGMRIKWWIEDKLDMMNVRRWEKLCDRLMKMKAPANIDEYKVLWKMFMRTSKKCNDWCRYATTYSIHSECEKECRDKIVEQLYEVFIHRLSYCSDRMGMNRWLGLCT